MDILILRRTKNGRASARCLLDEIKAAMGSDAVAVRVANLSAKFSKTDGVVI